MWISCWNRCRSRRAACRRTIRGLPAGMRRRGYKISYVPTTLPDLVKTEAVIEHEYRAFEAKSAG